jgi:hypothetical protein
MISELKCRRQLVRERRQPGVHAIAGQKSRKRGKSAIKESTCVDERIVIRRLTYKVWIALVASPHTVQMLEWIRLAAVTNTLLAKENGFEC